MEKRMFDLNRLETSCEYAYARGKEVVFYPYRTAKVNGLAGMIEIKCESPEEMESYRALKNRLCKMATKVLSSKGELVDVESAGEITPDNHICFMVGDTAIMFSDWEIRIGTELVVKSW